MTDAPTADLFIFHQDRLERKTDAMRHKWPENANLAIAPYMYLTDNVYDQLHTDTPTIESQRVYVHELAHIKRQESFLAGVTVWWWIYERFSKFRLNEEIQAIQAELVFFAINNWEYPIAQKAESLSSSLYHNMIGYVDSKILISTMWRNVLEMKRQRE